MKDIRLIILGSIHTCILVVAAGSLQAQQTQTSGEPGSPGATTTIDGRYLPPAPQPFHGDIQPNAYQSKPYWPALRNDPRFQKLVASPAPKSEDK